MKFRCHFSRCAAGLALISLFVSSLCLCVGSALAQDAPKTRTLVDHLGNEVVLPYEVNRVVIASAWPLASMFCLFQGDSDKLVGLDPAIISAARNSLLVKVAPEIVDVPSGFSQNGVLNVEELLKLKPDVVLYASPVKSDYETCKKAGIPAVGFSLSVRNFNAVDTVNCWMELLGQVMNREVEAREFAAYGQEIQNMVKERLRDLPEGKKPRCLFVHGTDGLSLRVPGVASWADYWITASGGVNVAAEVGKGFKSVNLEQIYAWDPEKIFITNFVSLLPEDLIRNEIPGQDWSPVKAVKDGAVKKLPLGMYRWYVTCPDSALMLLWMAKENHPDIFSDIDMNQTIRDFYRRFYGVDTTEAEIASIFVPKRDAAGGI